MSASIATKKSAVQCTEGKVIDRRSRINAWRPAGVEWNRQRTEGRGETSGHCEGEIQVSIEQFLATFDSRIDIIFGEKDGHIIAVLEEIKFDGDALIAVGTGSTVQEALDRLMVEFKKATIERVKVKRWKVRA